MLCTVFDFGDCSPDICLFILYCVVCFICVLCSLSLSLSLSPFLFDKLISYTYMECFHWALCQIKGPLASHNFCPLVALSCWNVCQSIKCYCLAFKICFLKLFVFRNSKHKMYHCPECYSKKKQNFVQMKIGFKITDTKAVVFKTSVSQGCTDFPYIFTAQG